MCLCYLPITWCHCGFCPLTPTIALLFIPDYRLADGLSNRIPHNQSQDFSTTSSHNSSERSGSLSGWFTWQRTSYRKLGHHSLRGLSLWLTGFFIGLLICYLQAQMCTVPFLHQSCSAHSAPPSHHSFVWYNFPFFFLFKNLTFWVKYPPLCRHAVIWNNGSVERKGAGHCNQRKKYFDLLLQMLMLGFGHHCLSM